MKDNVLDFIEDHRVLCIIGIIVVILIIVMFGIRSSNLKKKELAEQERVRQEEIAKQESEQASLEQDVEPEPEPENAYKASLGIDADKDADERIEVVVEPETETEEPEEPEPQVPAYDTVVRIFGNTVVPKKNMDGSSCKAYQNGIKLKDFGTFWGSSLTDSDFTGGTRYLVGVEQNPDDVLKGDLMSLGWLIDNIDNLNDNDAIKFTNLHVIGHLSTSHVAMLCSYDWYSAFGLKDTLVVFEDISNTLKISDFGDGDIFSATVFRHNIKVLDNVNGQRVVVVEYATFD